MLVALKGNSVMTQNQQVTFEYRQGRKWIAGTGYVLHVSFGVARIVGRVNGKRVQFDTIMGYEALVRGLAPVA